MLYHCRHYWREQVRPVSHSELLCTITLKEYSACVYTQFHAYYIMYISHSHSFLDLGLPLWLGGAPSLSASHVSSQDITACVRQVLVNGDMLDLNSHIDQSNSQPGCPQVCTYTSIHPSIHPYIHPYIHTCIHTYIRSFIDTY